MHFLKVDHHVIQLEMIREIIPDGQFYYTNAYGNHYKHGCLLDEKQYQRLLKMMDDLDILEDLNSN